MNEKKKELNKKIAELEDKLRKLSIKYPPEKPVVFVQSQSPVGDETDTIKQVMEARKDSEQRAGLVKNTGDGSTLPEDYNEADRIPKNSIHKFDILDECVCECHLTDKMDCLLCYDHPVHLEAKRPQPKPDDGYDEAKITELIEEDKAKKNKKSWWRR